MVIELQSKKHKNPSKDLFTTWKRMKADERVSSADSLVTVQLSHCGAILPPWHRREPNRWWQQSTQSVTTIASHGITSSHIEPNLEMETKSSSYLISFIIGHGPPIKRSMIRCGRLSSSRAAVPILGGFLFDWFFFLFFYLFIWLFDYFCLLLLLFLSNRTRSNRFQFWASWAPEFETQSNRSNRRPFHMMAPTKSTLKRKQTSDQSVTVQSIHK